MYRVDLKDLGGGIRFCRFDHRSFVQYVDSTKSINLFYYEMFLLIVCDAQDTCKKLFKTNFFRLEQTPRTRLHFK